MSDSYRMREIFEKCEFYKNPFNTDSENHLFDCLCDIAVYCEKTKCSQCKIKPVLCCSGKAGFIQSPFNFFTFLDTKNRVNDFRNEVINNERITKQRNQKQFSSNFWLDAGK